MFFVVIQLLVVFFVEGQPYTDYPPENVPTTTNVNPVNGRVNGLVIEELIAESIARRRGYGTVCAG